MALNLRPAQLKALRSLPKSWLHPAHMPDIYVELLDLGWAKVVDGARRHTLTITETGALARMALEAGMR